MGFFLRDLYKQIRELHQKQVASYKGKPFIVYRGQSFSKAKLQKTKRGLMSFNNLLSTNTKRDVSLRFAKGALRNPDMIGILFKMFINLSISSTPYASIQPISYFKNEEEIFFFMHTVFRVDEITKLDKKNSLYQVELSLTADDDQQLRILTDRILGEVVGKTDWQRLGHLLATLGHFGKAEELYNLLLQ
jgi:hypothetical protein